MLKPELARQIRGIEVKLRRLVTDVMAGNYVSTFKGRGMQFDEVREYVPGDEVRTIDWNVTARMGTPFVKVLREERELTMVVLVDVSPSQEFGEGGRTKREAAAEMAAALALLAIRNRDKVGLIVFSDHIEHYIPPKRGRAHVWNIIRSVLTHVGKGRTTDIRGALEFLLRVTPRRAMVFLVSDFWADQYDAPLRAAGRRHDLIAVEVKSGRERVLPDAGVLLWRDKESQAVVLKDTSDPRVRLAFQNEARQRDASLAAGFAAAGVERIDLPTNGNPVAPLAAFFRRRARQRRR